MKSIIYSQENRIATVTINRPKKLNALNTRAYSELHDAIEQFLADQQAAVLVLTGAGRAFCAGQDLDEVDTVVAQSESETQKGLQIIQNITRLLIASDKPTLAAINGPAVGAGAEIPLACDLRFGREGCFFEFPELRHGLFNTNASTCLLSRLIGHSRASELLLLGERISAQTALQFGLLNRLLDEQSFAEKVTSAACRLRDNNTQASALLKQALRHNPHAGVEKSLELERSSLTTLLSAHKLREH